MIFLFVIGSRLPTTCILLMKNGIESQVGYRADARNRCQKLCRERAHRTPPGLHKPQKCSELLNPARESCVILSQRQPGKFKLLRCNSRADYPMNTKLHRCSYYLPNKSYKKMQFLSSINKVN